MTDLRNAAQQALEALLDDPNKLVQISEHHWESKRDLAVIAIRAALAEPVQAWHFIDCEGECLACLIEREVKATYGNQGLAYLRRHVGGSNESA